MPRNIGNHELTESELKFINAVRDAVSKSDKDTTSIRIERMSDKTLSVCYNDYYIGRINYKAIKHLCK